MENMESGFAKVEENEASFNDTIKKEIDEEDKIQIHDEPSVIKEEIKIEEESVVLPFCAVYVKEEEEFLAEDKNYLISYSKSHKELSKSLDELPHATRSKRKKKKQACKLQCCEIQTMKSASSLKTKQKRNNNEVFNNRLIHNKKNLKRYKKPNQKRIVAMKTVKLYLTADQKIKLKHFRKVQKRDKARKEKENILLINQNRYDQPTNKDDKNPEPNKVPHLFFTKTKNIKCTPNVQSNEPELTPEICTADIVEDTKEVVEHFLCREENNPINSDNLEGSKEESDNIPIINEIGKNPNNEVVNNSADFIPVAVKNIRKRNDYICSVPDCQFMTSFRNILMDHMTAHSDIKDKICDLCGKYYVYSTALENHKKSHISKPPPKKHFCNMCDFNSENFLKLKEHKLSHPDLKVFICDMCNKPFTSSKHIQQHKCFRRFRKNIKFDPRFPNTEIKCIDGTESYSCQLCKYKTKNSCLMLNHSNSAHTGSHCKAHAEVKDHLCDVCGKSFSKKDNLLKHRLTHSVEKLFKCELCSYECNNKYSLKKHMQMHAGDVFACHLCDHISSHRSQMKRHIQTHDKERKYKCNDCAYSTSDKSKLLQHVKRHFCNIEKPS